jgi:signal transduction histidine kinase
VLERGARLDERGGAAGLGLAIVQDVLDAYGWCLELSRSEFGGLKAAIGPRALFIEKPNRLSAKTSASSQAGSQQA